MSERGEAKDGCASRAKPRPEGHVCERGRRRNPGGNEISFSELTPHRRARPRAMAEGRQLGIRNVVSVVEAWK
jgi:hypothetical protein